MSNDDLVYISLLIFSIPFGFLFKLNLFKNQPRFKAFVSAILGITGVVVACGYDFCYSAALVLSNAILIKLVHPR